MIYVLKSCYNYDEQKYNKMFFCYCYNLHSNINIIYIYIYWEIIVLYYYNQILKYNTIYLNF